MPKIIEVKTLRGDWVVARRGRKSPLSTHTTQAKAEAAGRRQAKRDKAEFVLKGRDGRIRKKDSYGADSPSRRG
jgi:hypothetical protein